MLVGIVTTTTHAGKLWVTLDDYESCLPYFKKAENNEVHQDEYHGQGGPLNVANLRSAKSDVWNVT